MKSKFSLALTLFLFFSLIPVFAQSSEEEIQHGVASYKDSHYEQAIQHFEKAAELDPNNINAHL